MGLDLGNDNAQWRNAQRRQVKDLIATRKLPFALEQDCRAVHTFTPSEVVEYYSLVRSRSSPTATKDCAPGEAVVPLGLILARRESFLSRYFPGFGWKGASAESLELEILVGEAITFVFRCADVREEEGVLKVRVRAHIERHGGMKEHIMSPSNLFLDRLETSST